VRGAAAGLQTVAEIQNKKTMSSYYLLHAVLADFNFDLGNLQQARDHLLKALELTHVESEKQFLTRKLRRCADEESRVEVREASA
jgi:predicted RNA polymerase sigma factor